MEIEKWVLDDGRRAERRTTEEVNGEGQIERTIELHVENERPLNLQQRIVEKTKPFVYERTVEAIDPQSGEVVDHKVESIDPRVQMQLVEHIAKAPQMVSSQSVEENGDAVTRKELIDTVIAAVKEVKSEEDCHVTREEMIETIVSAVKAVKESQPKASFDANTVLPNKVLNQKLNSLGLADEISKKVSSTNMSPTDIAVLVIIVLEVVAILFYLFT